VTEAEHAVAAQAMFTRADSNHDSYVTQDEMQAFHAAMGKDAHHDAEEDAEDTNDKRMDQDPESDGDKNGT
jgi:hypothetical protein